MAKYHLIRRRNSQQNRADESPGHDAFLDIVANLVGILIILVVVVGAHAGASMVIPKASEHASIDLETIAADLESEKEQTRNLRHDNQSMEAQISDQNQLFMASQFKRQRMLMLLEQMKSAIASSQESLQAQQKEQFAERQHVLDLELELNRARAEFSAVESEQKSRSETIVHYPTPVAKTVFNDEVHFRIVQGRIVAVPVDPLVDKMRSEWKHKAEKLTTAERTVESVGPIENFRLQYTLEAEELKTQTEIGVISERKIAFRRFVLLPRSDRIGEPVEQALNGNSEFKRRISSLTPGKTTVSIWIYPDSYPEFNQVKQYLQQAGFQTAIWPLPHGRLISGGPDGYRSSAQ